MISLWGCAVGAAPRPAADAAAAELGASGSPGNPAGAAAYHFAMAQLLSAEGRMEDADASYRVAVDLDPDAPYLRLSYADFLYGAGAIPEAAVQLRAALERIPDDVEALRLAARVELAQIQESPEAFERALASLERIAELDPNDLDSQLALGRLYLEADRSADAVGVFEGLLRVVPANGRIRTLLVEALMRAPGDTDAEGKLTTLLETAPEFLPARLAKAQLLADRGEFAGVVALLRDVPEIQRFDEELMSRLAGALYHTAELDEANRVLDELLRIEPGHPSGNFFRALVYQAEGRHDEAEEVTRALLDSNPGEVQLIQMLITSLEGQGDWEGLSELLEAEAGRSVADGEVERARAFRMSNIVAQARGERWAEVLVLVAAMEAELPGDVDLALLRSEALHRLGRTDDAIEVLAGVEPNEDYRRDLAVRTVQYMAEGGRPDEAKKIAEEFASTGDVDDLRVAAEAYQRAELYDESVGYLERLALEDDSIDVQFWLAAAYERIGERKKSIARFEALLERRPDFAPALNYLGYMWAEKGENLEEARELIERAVEIDPANGAYVDSLGWVLFQQGRYDDAVRYLERAARLVLDDAVVLEHLADAQRKLGRSEEARANYERSLALEAENADAVREKLRELNR